MAGYQIFTDATADLSLGFTEEQAFYQLHRSVYRFSPGMSDTIQSAHLCMEELRQECPERRNVQNEGLSAWIRYAHLLGKDSLKL